MSSELSVIAKNCFEGYVLPVPIEAFGRNIKRLRLALEPPLNGKELAEAISTDPSVVSKWENGKGGLPETPTLFRLAKKLQAPIEEILAGVDEDYDSLRRDLPRHKLSESSTPHPGGSDVPASARARIQQLEEQVKAQQAVIGDVQNVARTLFNLVLPTEGRSTRTGKARRRKAHRTAS
jgi:transcriptional regulator with XRE-family HTH domain